MPTLILFSMSSLDVWSASFPNPHPSCPNPTPQILQTWIQSFMIRRTSLTPVGITSLTGQMNITMPAFVTYLASLEHKNTPSHTPITHTYT